MHDNNERPTPAAPESLEGDPAGEIGDVLCAADGLAVAVEALIRHDYGDFLAGTSPYLDMARAELAAYSAERLALLVKGGV